MQWNSPCTVSSFKKNALDGTQKIKVLWENYDLQLPGLSWWDSTDIWGQTDPFISLIISIQWQSYRKIRKHHIIGVLSCFSRVQLFAAIWTVAHQAPPSVGFSRQAYWSGLPFPSPGDLTHPGIESAPLTSPALQAGSHLWRSLPHRRAVEILRFMERILWEIQWNLVILSCHGGNKWVPSYTLLGQRSLQYHTARERQWKINITAAVR